MLTIIKRLVKEEEAQGMTEYGLILALVAVVVIGALTVLGGRIDYIIRAIAGELDEPVVSTQ